jgi:hypothetical protein
MKLPSASCVCSVTPLFAMSEANRLADRRVDVEAILARRRFLDEVTDAADDLARPKRTGVSSSADADVGLHQRVDPFGQPQQRGADRSHAVLGIDGFRQISMRKVDGWQTLASNAGDQPIDLAV